MRSFRLIPVAGLSLALFAGCSTAPHSQADREILEKEANVTIQKFKTADPDMQKFYDESFAYAVFPSITKGGWFLGGAHGQGILYEKGDKGHAATGFVDTTHATIGLQWGGQTFSEVVFLQNKEAADALKFGKMKFSASVSAVAAKAGASKAVDYSDGVAIFTTAEAGLMVEGALGGQKFGYQPK
jgi:lipid-binding SYLF domain-containing protein